jgi:hypothetical protein
MLLYLPERGLLGTQARDSAWLDLARDFRRGEWISAGTGIASRMRPPDFVSGVRGMPRRIARMYFEEAIGTRFSPFSLFFYRYKMI